MSGPYDPSKSYLLGGAALNRMIEEIKTNRLLPSSEYQREILPGVGTRLKDIRSAAALSLWGLDIVDGESASVKLTNPGTIIKLQSDLTGALSVTGIGSTFTPSAGQTLHFKFTGIEDSLACSLLCAGDWDGHPAPYEISGSGSGAEYEAYYYPLWEFLDAPGHGTIPIAAGVHARKLVNETHFLAETTVHQSSTNIPLDVPVLVQYHRALAA